MSVGDGTTYLCVLQDETCRFQDSQATANGARTYCFLVGIYGLISVGNHDFPSKYLQILFLPLMLDV